MNAGTREGTGRSCKLDFERAVLNRIRKIRRTSEVFKGRFSSLRRIPPLRKPLAKATRPGDENILHLSRQPKCITTSPHRASARYAPALPGGRLAHPLQTFARDFSLALPMIFPERTAAISVDAGPAQSQLQFVPKADRHSVSWLTGKALSHKAQHRRLQEPTTRRADYRFDMKTFMALRKPQSVVIPYDGAQSTPPRFAT